MEARVRHFVLSAALAGVVVSLLAVPGTALGFALVDATGRRVHVPARTLRFGLKLKLGKRKLVAPIAVEPGAQPLQLNGVGYRGSLVLLAANGKLSAINVVPLERYLRGVVPSE